MLPRKVDKLVRRTPFVQWWRTFSGRTFRFDDHELPYAVHRRNYTWTNERCVELPIALQVLGRHRTANPRSRVLEVGNVLSRYTSVNHVVVDKYEQAANVINDDIIGYRGEQPYDLILSISTIEHIGWDCGESQDDKIPEAIDSIIENLAPGGEFLVTMPLGFNPFLDELLGAKSLPFTRQRFLKRVSPDNQWVETDWQNVRRTKYDSPYICANAIVVAEYKKAA